MWATIIHRRVRAGGCQIELYMTVGFIRVKCWTVWDSMGYDAIGILTYGKDIELLKRRNGLGSMCKVFGFPMLTGRNTRYITDRYLK